MSNATGKAQVAVGEGRQDRPAIDLHRQPQQAVAVQQWLGLEAQTGRISVRPDQPEAALVNASLPTTKGDDRGAAANHEMPPAG